MNETVTHEKHLAAMADRATAAWYEADQDRGGMAAMRAYYEGYLAALKERTATPVCVHEWVEPLPEEIEWGRSCSKCGAVEPA